MITRISDPLFTIPVAIVCCSLGGVVSGTVFIKLSHLVEYNLNKTFGDYKNPKKTLDDKIIVSMPRQRDYYYIQNIALAALVGLISSKTIQLLVLAGSLSAIATSLLVGSVAAPILFALVNMILHYKGVHRDRWIQISDAEINKHGINRDNLQKMNLSEVVYCGFGAAPTQLPGRSTDFNGYH